MFLSTENPPNDPLSPSSSSLLHLSSPHHLAHSHLSNFSIRDYAYSNRKKSINNSWPFSPKSLQLFSTHGVKDPLPPFQIFSTATNQFVTTSDNQIASYVHQGGNLVTPETLKGVSKNGLFTTTTTSNSKGEIVLASTSKKNTKKCGRGMVKSKEDTCNGLVTTFESTMASKTCPICKTFSSASNTTLNAHIDQCLSAESTMPPVSTKPSKPRVKPRMKVKTMVEIYASAKGCTLEDLDKRNGTKWVSILSYTNNRVVADNSEAPKKPKASPVGVGPVYIDDKGQKLRILSDFGQKKTSTTPLREQREIISTEKKCLSQGSKGNNASSRKRRRGRKPHEHVKLTNHKANSSEIPESPRGFSGEGSSTGRRRIFNQRMLAKRGLVSKKLNEKGDKYYALGNQPSESSDDDLWSEERDPSVTRVSATVSSRLNNERPRRTCNTSEVACRNQSLFGSKRAQKEEELLAKAHLNKRTLKRNLASIQEDKYPPVKNSFSNTGRLSLPACKTKAVMELKKARLDFSDEDDEEETGKWESEMTQERELSYDDYFFGDNGETNEFVLRSNTSSSGYDDYDDDEESSKEEDNNNRGNDTGAEFYSDTPPSVDIIPTEGAMYYSEEVGNMSYGQTACEDNVRFDTEVGQGNLFVDVDTIPIPGPPGSFLPSPRDMGHDETLGNSSVITSQLQSSMDHLDRNSSESPVSAVSNFANGRMNFPAELSSFRENLSADIPGSYLTTPRSFCSPSQHGTNTDVEPITIDKTTPSRFRNNDLESCCCQRKERISECITLNHQASHLLQRRAASSALGMNLIKSPSCLDPNYPFEQSPYMIQQDLDVQSKLSSRTNLNSRVPPSPSNPVLRLMGKDLMVMNQGEADDKESSRTSLKPTPQFLDPPPPCAGTGLYFNTGLYLRNNFEATHQPQTPKAQAQQTQASTFRNNFDNIRYYSPS